MDKNWYFHYSPYLVYIFEGMATHILQNSLEQAWDLSDQTQATAMPYRHLSWLSRFPQNQNRKKALLDLFLTTISGQGKLTTLLGYKGNLDN